MLRASAVLVGNVMGIATQREACIVSMCVMRRANFSTYVRWRASVIMLHEDGHAQIKRQPTQHMARISSRGSRKKRE